MKKSLILFSILLCSQTITFIKAHAWSVRIGPISMGHNRHRGVQVDILSKRKKEEEAKRQREAAENEKQKRINTIKSQITNLETDILGLSGQINGLKQNITELRSDQKYEEEILEGLSSTKLTIQKMMEQNESMSSTLEKLSLHLNDSIAGNDISSWIVEARKWVDSTNPDEMILLNDFLSDLEKIANSRAKQKDKVLSYLTTSFKKSNEADFDVFFIYLSITSSTSFERIQTINGRISEKEMHVEAIERQITEKRKKINSLNTQI